MPLTSPAPSWAVVLEPHEGLEDVLLGCDGRARHGCWSHMRGWKVFVVEQVFCQSAVLDPYEALEVDRVV